MSILKCNREDLNKRDRIILVLHNIVLFNVAAIFIILWFLNERDIIICSRLIGFGIGVIQALDALYYSDKNKKRMTIYLITTFIFIAGNIAVIFI